MTSPISLFLGVTRDVADFAISAFWDLAVKDARSFFFLVKKRPAEHMYVYPNIPGLPEHYGFTRDYRT